MLRESPRVPLGHEHFVLFLLGDALRDYFDFIIREPLPELMIALVKALEALGASPSPDD